MNAQLVFIHGRAQEHKNSIALKDEWIDAWSKGLAKSGRQLPISEADIRFPYYGQTLYELVAGNPNVPEVIVRGSTDRNALNFEQSVLSEVKEALGITDAEVEQALGVDIVQRGPLNWEWVQGILKVIDRRVPGGSAASIALATKDVYQYLRNPGVRDTIDVGVRNALSNAKPTIVVSHSLGTVVAFNLLRRDGAQLGWNVPLFVTLGSPLGIQAIRSGLSPIAHPSCVKHWYNAFDERDVVSLYPLDTQHFKIDPNIENHGKVKNWTDNRHGIAGYLDDEVVAARIHDAVVAAGG